MAGVFCIADSDARVLEAFTEESVRRKVCHFPWLRIASYSADGIRVFIVLPDNQDFSDHIYEDDDHYLVLFGVVSERELAAASSPRCATPEEICESMIKRGLPSLACLDGSYAIVLWRKRQRELHIANDWMGSRKLYYWRSPSGMVFGSEYKIAFLHPEFSRRLDEFSMVQFLRRNYLLENNNLLKDIQLMPPAALMSFNGKDLILNEYDQVRFSALRHNKEMIDLIEEYDELIKMQVLRLTAGSKKVIVPLSAGLDSRLLLAVASELKDRDFSLQAVNHGRKNCTETQGAIGVSRIAGVPLKRVLLNNDFLIMYQQSQSWLSELVADCHSTHWFPTIYALRSEHDRILSGYIGDVFAGSYIGYAQGIEQSSPTSTGRAERILDAFSAHLGRLSVNTCKKLLRKEYSFLVDNEQEKAMDCLAGTPGENSISKFSLFLLRTQMRRYISYILDYNANLGQVVAPYISKENAEFFFSLPPSLLHNRLFFKEYLTCKYRSYAEVIRLKGFLPLILPRSSKRLFITQYFRLLFNQEFSRKKDPEGWTNDLVYYPDVLRASESLFESCLNNPVLEQYFCIDELRKFKEDLFNGQDELYWQWFELLSLDIWIRQFIMNDRLPILS